MYHISHMNSLGTGDAYSRRWAGSTQLIKWFGAELEPKPCLQPRWPNPLQHVCDYPSPSLLRLPTHYSDAKMSALAFQTTGVQMVCLAVCSGADQRKPQSSASLALVRRIPVTGKFPAQTASNTENVSIWWRHHGFIGFQKPQSSIYIYGKYLGFRLHMWTVNIQGRFVCRVYSIDFGN